MSSRTSALRRSIENTRPLRIQSTTPGQGCHLPALYLEEEIAADCPQKYEMLQQEKCARNPEETKDTYDYDSAGYDDILMEEIPPERLIRFRLGAKLQCYDVATLKQLVSKENPTEPTTRLPFTAHQIEEIQRHPYQLPSTVVGREHAEEDFYAQVSPINRQVPSMQVTEVDVLRYQVRQEARVMRPNITLISYDREFKEAITTQNKLMVLNLLRVFLVEYTSSPERPVSRSNLAAHFDQLLRQMETDNIVVKELIVAFLHTRAQLRRHSLHQRPVPTTLALFLAPLHLLCEAVILSWLVGAREEVISWWFTLAEVKDSLLPTCVQLLYTPAFTKTLLRMFPYMCTPLLQHFIGFPDSTLIPPPPTLFPVLQSLEQFNPALTPTQQFRRLVQRNPWNTVLLQMVLRLNVDLHQADDRGLLDAIRASSAVEMLIHAQVFQMYPTESFNHILMLRALAQAWVTSSYQSLIVLLLYWPYTALQHNEMERLETYFQHMQDILPSRAMETTPDEQLIALIQRGGGTVGISTEGTTSVARRLAFLYCVERPSALFLEWFPLLFPELIVLSRGADQSGDIFQRLLSELDGNTLEQHPEVVFES